MSRFREAFDAGREAVRERLAEGKYYDPAGQGHNQARLRGMGRWRFILIRGIVGFAPPMFLFLVLSGLSEDIHTAQAFHQPALRYLLGHWMFGFCVSVCLWFVVGLLAWRRLVSDVWPGDKPDQESCITTLGPLSRQERGQDALSELPQSRDRNRLAVTSPRFHSSSLNERNVINCQFGGRRQLR